MRHERKASMFLPASLLLTAGIVQAQTAELAKLLASDGASSDLFGDSVSFSGDRALVGAPYDNSPGLDSGSAYVFERQPDGSWTEAAKLTASDALGFELFGSSVSLASDRALIGAPNDYVAGYVTGSAYVFERQSNGAWVEVAKLVPSDGSDTDNFGAAVSLSGDRSLVGAWGDDDKGSSSGSAYAFERQSNGAWVQSAKLLASDGAAGDNFGYSLSLQGDRALVGAWQDDDQGANAGSSFVFERQSNGTWLETAKLLASDGAAGDRCGRSVSLDGDRALTGAPNDDVGQALDAGSAHVFELQGSVWVETQELVADDVEEGSIFGFSVSLRGDRALIGAAGGGPQALGPGSAYAFERSSNGTWIQTAKILSSDGETADEFGYSVSLSGDRALVSARQDDDLGANAGSAYLFDLLPLSSTVTEISLSTGGTQPLELDAGHLHPNEPYLLLGSMSGTSPGVPLAGGFVLPLNPNRYFVRTLEFPNRAPLSNSRGTLNAAGHADASFSIVPLDVQLAGTTVHHAFATLGSIAAASTSSSSSSAPSPALATFVSNAFPIVFVP